ncbi:hypothetical protein P6U16_19750 [Rhizobium sp. 32-5/1]|uniref:hypothetical protein n=1 Tax=Rhizobium sp. 32-5/1 TaxID=3019602 RepID=UPI00240DBE47|nr:hypothetical protein [Rhizobium sp. 32-5/1]WEZ83097.1 hypothetical protein P6U16_19750 [Rhizobium sp. 32-5/1]
MLATIIPLIALFLIVWALATVIRSMRAPSKGLPAEERQIPDMTDDGPSPRSIMLRNQLSTLPYGDELARRLWLRLMAQKPRDGLVHEFHKEFCGHGLIHMGNGVMLADIYDGGHSTGEPIARWTSEAEFVAFFSRQSDFSCSGWDENEPVFFTSDDWYRNNQRLTRSAIDRFLNG